MAIPRPTMAMQVVKTRLKTSGRSIQLIFTRIGLGSSSPAGLPDSRPPWADRWKAGSLLYRWPIPRAVSPSPIRAPAVMIAPQSARMSVPLRCVVDGRSHVEHPQPAPADQEDAGQDDEQAATPAAGPDPVLAPRA